ncbi:hypothetical protein LTR53_005339 [Teratosphaeriaceae sp. CCFEE 6253]|nr:hypothetical protein LTR53_005339 [Teratosphaeriaceae sp. CCFEE 6253]
MVSFSNDLFFAGTEPIEPRGSDSLVPHGEGPPQPLDDDSDVEEDAPYENPQTGEVSLLKQIAPFDAADQRPSRSTRVIGGKAAIGKKVTIDYDSDDGRIIELKQSGYSDDYVAKKLVDEGRTRYQAKTVSSRWQRLRLVMDQVENDRLDDEMSDWHIGEDTELHESVKSIDEKIAAEVLKLMAKKWTQISDQVAERLQQKKFTGKACRERFEGLQNGSALLPIEIDEDQEGRRKLREDRIAAAKQRRVDAIKEAERAVDEVTARLEAKKAEAVEKEREKERLTRQRQAKKEQEVRMRKQRHDEMNAARDARRAIEALASAEWKWGKKQRLNERAIYEELAGKKYRRCIFTNLQDLLANNGNDVDADDESDDSDAEDASRPNARDSMLEGFSFNALLADAAAHALATATPESTAGVPPAPAVTAATLADARSTLSGDELVAILKERGLPATGREETHPQVIARLHAADKLLTTAELHQLMKRYFLKIKGTREAKLKVLAEEEVKRFGGP